MQAAGLVTVNASSTFVTWGAAIKLEFESDNLHLTARTTDTGIAQLVATMQRQTRTIGSLGQTVGTMHGQLASLQRELAALRQAGVAAPSTPAPARSPARRSATPRQSPGMGASPASPANTTTASSAVDALFADEAAAADDADAADDAADDAASPPLSAPLAGFHGLLPTSGQNSSASISGQKAFSFYQNCMANGGALPAFEAKLKQQKTKAELCLKWFNAMATAEEMVILKPPAPAAAGEPVPKPDTGKRRTICTELNRLMVALLCDAYESASLEVPRDFEKDGYLLPASGIATHTDSQLKAKGRVPDTFTFAAWRRAHEDREQQQVGAAGASSGPPKKKSRKK